MILQKSTVVSGAVLSFLIPILLTGCTETVAGPESELSRADVQEMVRAEVAAALSATEPGLNRAEVQQIIASELEAMFDDRANVEETVQETMVESDEILNSELEAILDRSDIEEIVDDAVREVMRRVLTRPDVEKIVEESTHGMVTGTITFNGHAAIPDGAVLSVELRDTSLQDVSSVLIASQTIEDPQRFPIRFTVPYDPEGIAPRATYSLSISINLDDRLIFINDTAFDVLTRGNPSLNVETWVISVR